MSSSYSANQYDSAFRSQRLQNWCETKRFKERPTAQEGHTTFIADDRGHLLPGVVKRGSAWPDFKGTWDLPARIPARCINPTGRSVEGLNRLKSWGIDPQHTGRSQPHRGSKNKDRLQHAGETDGDVQLDGAEAQSASQDRPITGSQRPASQKQDSRAAEVGSPEHPAADQEPSQVIEKDSVAEGRASSMSADPKVTINRSGTGEERPVSNVAERSASREAPPSSKQAQRCTPTPVNS